MKWRKQWRIVTSYCFLLNHYCFLLSTDLWYSTLTKNWHCSFSRFRGHSHSVFLSVHDIRQRQVDHTFVSSTENVWQVEHSPKETTWVRHNSANGICQGTFFKVSERIPWTERKMLYEPILSIRYIMLGWSMRNRMCWKTKWWKVKCWMCWKVKV